MKYLEKMRAGEEEVIQSKKNVIRFTRSFDWSVVHSRYYSQVSQFIVRENDHSVQ